MHSDNMFNPLETVDCYGNAHTLNDSFPPINNVKTCLLCFLIIIKHFLQNCWKILKKCFLCLFGISVWGVSHYTILGDPGESIEILFFQNKQQKKADDSSGDGGLLGYTEERTNPDAIVTMTSLMRKNLADGKNNIVYLKIGVLRSGEVFVSIF